MGWKTIISILTLSLILAAPAWAHRVSVFADGQGPKIEGEGYFSGGGACKGCPVVVYDAAGKKLAETKTGPDGAFSLEKPAGQAPFTLEMSAGTGHKASFRLTAADLGLENPPAKPAPAGAAATPAKPREAASPVAAGIGKEELEKIVAKAVAREVAPLRKTLTRLVHEKRIGVREVVGGLGWILGLVGIVFYFQARRKGNA